MGSDHPVKSFCLVISAILHLLNRPILYTIIYLFERLNDCAATVALALCFCLSFPKNIGTGVRNRRSCSMPVACHCETGALALRRLWQSPPCREALPFVSRLPRREEQPPRSNSKNREGCIDKVLPFKLQLPEKSSFFVGIERYNRKINFMEN